MPQRYIRYDGEYSYVDDHLKQRTFPSLNDKATLTLSVIVPAKDEQTRLPKMLDEAIDYLQQRTRDEPAFTWEIIVVDDGSTDNTTKVAHKYAKKVSSERLRVLTLEKNRGKGGAVRLGVLCARGRHILFADADGATTFSCVRQLETALCSLLGTTKTAVDSFTRLPVSSDARTAIAVGSRAHMERASMAQRSLARTILMLGFHALVRIFGGVHTVHDTQCGFKLFSRRAARLLFPQLHIERWAFDVELLYTAECLRIPIAEVQVEWEEIDGSKIVPVWSWLQMGRDLLLIWARYTFRIWTVEQEPPLDE